MMPSRFRSCVLPAPARRGMRRRSGPRTFWGSGVILALMLPLLVLASCERVDRGAEFPADSPERPASPLETVIVAHGLGRTTASMAILAGRLEDAGYHVVRFGYPSTEATLDDLVALLEETVESCCADAPETVHFVAHSMGGVVAWSWIARHSPGHEGRVVLLSPPSRGSEIIDALEETPLLESALGPAGSRLGTDSTDIPASLPPVDFTLGVITGDRSLDPIGSWLIPGPDDGKVAVDRARVEGAADFLVLPATHTFIMNREDVAEQAIRFLRNGQFRRE